MSTGLITANVTSIENKFGEECGICYTETPELFGHLSGNPPQLSHLMCKVCLDARISRIATCPSCAIQITSVNGQRVGAHFTEDEERRFKRSLSRLFEEHGFPLQQFTKMEIPHLRDANEDPMQDHHIHRGAPDHWGAIEPVSDEAIVSFEDARGRLGLAFNLVKRDSPEEKLTMTCHARYDGQNPEGDYACGLCQYGYARGDTIEQFFQKLLTDTHPTYRLDGPMPERVAPPRRGLCSRIYRYFW